MKIHHLLQQRSSLRRRTRLADVAFVFNELGKFAARIARGQLRGRVTLDPADPDAQRAWPALVAEEGNQSVLEEHFLDQDLLDLYDLLRFATGTEHPAAFTFAIEELGGQFRAALRQELEQGGVELPPHESELTEDRNRDSA
jgi:hypothetical protein